MWWKKEKEKICYVGRPEAVFCELHFFFCFTFTLKMFFVLLFVKLKKKERKIYDFFIAASVFFFLFIHRQVQEQQKYLWWYSIVESGADLYHLTSRDNSVKIRYILYKCIYVYIIYDIWKLHNVFYEFH